MPLAWRLDVEPDSALDPDVLRSTWRIEVPSGHFYVQERVSFRWNQRHKEVLREFAFNIADGDSFKTVAVFPTKELAFAAADEIYCTRWPLLALANLA